MGKLYAIALNTFREAIRNRVFATLILFAIALLLLTLAVSSASLHEEIRLMKDVGLFFVSIFSVIIAVFIGTSLVYKEIERKTIYTIAPKPVYRFQILIGKYLGLAVTIAIQLAFMGAVLALNFFWLDAHFGIEMIEALWLIYVEVLIVMSVAIVFSSFSTPFLSGLLTVGVFIVGRFVDQLLTLQLVRLEEQTPFTQGIQSIIRLIARITPDLSLYDVTPQVVYAETIPWSFVGHATLYGFCYAGLALVIASFLFSRRDFV